MRNAGPARHTRPVAPDALGFSRVLPGCLVVGAGIALGLAWRLDVGRAALGLAGLGTAALGGLLLCLLRRLTPRLLSSQIIVFVFSFQAAWLFVVAVIGVQTRALGLIVDVSQYPLASCLPLLLVPIGAVLSAAIIRPVFGRPLPSSRDSTRHHMPGLNLFLVGGALLTVGYWPAALTGSGPVGYLTRILSSSLLLLPFVGGKYTIGKRHLTILWWICMGISFFVGVFSGSRFPAFAPPVLFTVGRIFGLKGAQQKRLVAFSLACSIPLFAVAGIVGVVRTKIGRGGLELIDSSRIDQVLDASKRVLSAENSSAAGESSLESDSVSRLIAWSNQVVTITTPKLYSYRGLDTLWDEAKASATISALSGTTSDDLNREGLYSAPANRYGFMVNSENSVEFGLLADAWSRGGPWMTLVAGILVGLWFGLLEMAISKVSRILPAVGMLLLCVCLRGAMDTERLALLANIRASFLDPLLVGTLGFVLEVVRQGGSNRPLNLHRGRGSEVSALPTPRMPS